MKTIIIALLAASSIGTHAFANDFVAVPEYQQDFEKAKQCQTVNGRLVWQGYEGFYIQSTQYYTDASGELSQDTVSAIPFEYNQMKVLKPFFLACK